MRSRGSLLSSSSEFVLGRDPTSFGRKKQEKKIDLELSSLFGKIVEIQMLERDFLVKTTLKFIFQEMMEISFHVHTKKYAKKTLNKTTFCNLYKNTKYKGVMTWRKPVLVTCLSFDPNDMLTLNNSAWSGLQIFGLGRVSVYTIGLGPSRAFDNFKFFGLGLFGLCLERAFGLKLLNIFLKIETLYNFYFSKIEAFDKTGCSMH